MSCLAGPFVDAHVHLQEEVLEPLLPGVLERARRAGVSTFICNGTHPGDWGRVAWLARTVPGVLPCYGLHPWFTVDRPAGWLDDLAPRLRAGALALGEIGLDHARPGLDEAAQRLAFRQQLALARELDLPAVIHCVRAWGTLAELLAADGPPARGFQLHAYGGPAEMVAPLLRLGAYFSFAGTAVNPRSTRVRAALAQVPADRLLVETDAPALVPVPEFRPSALTGPGGEPLNEPANLPAILAGVAALRGVLPEALAQTVRDNACRLLGDACCSPTPSPAPA
jgi:TatD DNase family protein